VTVFLYFLNTFFAYTFLPMTFTLLCFHDFSVVKDESLTYVGVEDF